MTGAYPRPSTTANEVRDATAALAATTGTIESRTRAVVILANLLTSLRRDGVDPRAILATVAGAGLAQAIVTELDTHPSPESALFERRFGPSGSLPRVAPADITEPGTHGAPRAAGCPDGGSCHHDCSAGTCYRVAWCGPLSGRYPGDRWPEDVKP